MTRFKRIAPVALAAGLAAFGIAARRAEPQGKTVELEEAKVSIEWNSTADDYGVQFFWDGDAWSRMTIRNTDGNVALVIDGKANVRKHGLTESFFESSEPPASVLSREAFFQRFPEGEYTFEALTLDGSKMTGEAEFTHVLPAPPANVAPRRGDVVARTGFTVSFDPVTRDVNGAPVAIASYEVIVEKTDEDPILQTFDVILRPSVHEVLVPEGFLEPDTEYVIEVIAVEEGGNKTITESGPFRTGN